MARLAANEYGKSHVRLLKVIRNSVRHIVKEWDVSILHSGDYESCFTHGDNSKILPTDTMKNTVYSVARSSSALTIEDFAAELVAYFLDRNPQAIKVTVEIVEKPWHPISVDGQPHPTAFHQGSSVRHTTLVTQTRDGDLTVASGIDKLLILKTADSGFVGYIKDPLTTLRETTDRLLGTEVSAEWAYASGARAFDRLRCHIVDTLLKTFAEHKSLSVQQTLFDIGAAILEHAPEVLEVDLSMPNKHCLLVDLCPFAQDNPNEIFVPTEEPHGTIHAVIRRDEIKA